MPLYEYLASSIKTGELVKGELEADSLRNLRVNLRNNGLVLLEYSESGKQVEKSKSVIGVQLKRVGYADLTIFTKQFVTLLSAGFQLVPALSKASQLVKNQTLKASLVQIREKVEEGKSFSAALSAYPNIFPDFYINMVAAGERSGNLEAVLHNLASFLERQVELTRKVVSSLFYPAIMLLLSVVVIIVLFTVVVPQIAEIFVKEGAKLPFITRLILGVSWSIKEFWWLILGVILLIFLRINQLRKTDEGKGKIDKFIYSLPVVGEILFKIDIARFALTLGSLLRGGVGIVNALELSIKVLQSSVLRQNVVSALDDVKRGRSLSVSLSSSKFPDLFLSMIAVGEQSGNLEKMLLNISDYYEKDATHSLQTLVNLIEPILIVIIGLIVLIVVFAVITPIVDMINILKK